MSFCKKACAVVFKEETEAEWRDHINQSEGCGRVVTLSLSQITISQRSTTQFGKKGNALKPTVLNFHQRRFRRWWLLLHITAISLPFPIRIFLFSLRRRRWKGLAVRTSMKNSWFAWAHPGLSLIFNLSHIFSFSPFCLRFFCMIVWDLSLNCFIFCWTLLLFSWEWLYPGSWLMCVLVKSREKFSKDGKSGFFS